MARISLDPPRTLPYRIGEWFLRRQFGEVLDPFRAQAHNMPVAQAFGRLEQGAAKWTTLDPKLRDLADLTAAVKIGCPWCMDFGYWILHGRGISSEKKKLEAVPNWRTSPLFDPLERLVMEYAEVTTETPPTVDDELVKRLRAHLDEAQLVELTAIVCLENVRSRLRIQPIDATHWLNRSAGVSKLSVSLGRSFSRLATPLSLF
jgi:alkylhydroperoxidase family enzyme